MKYQTKVVIVSAIQFDGKFNKLREFLDTAAIICMVDRDKFCLNTFEQNLSLSISDWIIKHENGQFSICFSSDFEKLYEPYKEEIFNYSSFRPYPYGYIR